MTKLSSLTADDDNPTPGEATPLLSPSSHISSGTSESGTVEDKRELFQSFRRRSVAKLSLRQGAGSSANKLLTSADIEMELLPLASPVEGLAPLFPNGGIGRYDDRECVPYREASLVKSVPAFPPYRRKARHRSFYLWWTNVSMYECTYLVPMTSVNYLCSMHIIMYGDFDIA